MDTSVWVFLLFEIIIAVACCLGNVLVIWLVWTSGALRKPPFCFIVSLAVADFLVGSTGIPLTILVELGIKISDHGCLCMCCVVLMLQVASVAILLAIAFDRFLRVCIPLRYKATVSKKLSWMVVAFCWLTAALLSFIPMFGWHNQTRDSTSKKCSLYNVFSYSYVVNLLFFSFFLPLLFVMTGLYCYIFLTTRKQLRANIGVAAQSRRNCQKEHRLAASLVLVLVLCAVCLLPLLLMFTLYHYHPNIQIPHVVYDIGVLLSQANSAFNPIVYAFNVPRIKGSCRKTLRRAFPSKCQQSEQHSNADRNMNITAESSSITYKRTIENNSATQSQETTTQMSLSSQCRS
ncbi:adenosine receptor A1-like [Hoplias malabaricus]|uniref:adenosine receptor A1-like n=1 Tax=Hoplias malabaricus TaxID=27720 RepID=UPI0034635EA1